MVVWGCFNDCCSWSPVLSLLHLSFHSSFGFTEKKKWWSRRKRRTTPKAWCYRSTWQEFMELQHSSSWDLSWPGRDLQYKWPAVRGRLYQQGIKGHDPSLLSPMRGRLLVVCPQIRRWVYPTLTLQSWQPPVAPPIAWMTAFFFSLIHLFPSLPLFRSPLGDGLHLPTELDHAPEVCSRTNCSDNRKTFTEIIFRKLDLLKQIF